MSELLKGAYAPGAVVYLAGHYSERFVVLRQTSLEQFVALRQTSLNARLVRSLSMLDCEPRVMFAHHLSPTVLIEELTDEQRAVLMQFELGVLDDAS